MRYDTELNFFRKILKNMSLDSWIISGNQFPENIDHGLRSFLGIPSDREKTVADMQKYLSERTIYVVKDEFMCKYIMFILPETTDFRVFFCGPYITNEVNKKMLMENSEKYNISPQLFAQLSKYYSNITLISDESVLSSMFNSMGEILWGSINDFSIQRIEKSSQVSDNDIINVFEEKSEQSMLTISIIEARYEAERNLMDAVSRGQGHKVAHYMGHISDFIFEQRTKDTARNIKNYMIVLNTLLRKAVQEGGVPPYFIDKLSSEFAKKIELSSGGKDTEKIASDMVEKYSQLVTNHSLKKYSACIQKAIEMIDYDLTADLSLKNVARSLETNPSYFSTLFRKETGKTYTEYVNEKRIEKAQKLLSSTTLQIQTVAQHCGILDVNYFTKLFKKITGTTPGRYRADEY